MPPLDPWLFPIIAVLLGGVGSVILVRGLFGRWFRAGGRSGRVRSCRKCRFDLSATEGHTCPECGHTARHEAEHYAGRFRWPVAVLALVLLLAALSVAMMPGVQRDGWLGLLPMDIQSRVFHLESNDRSLWRFRERLEGRAPIPTQVGGLALSWNNDDVSPEVKAWRDRACQTAARVVGSPASRPVEQVARAQAVLDRHGRLHLPGSQPAVPGTP